MITKKEEEKKMQKEEVKKMLETQNFLEERLKELKVMFSGHGNELTLKWRPGQYPIETIGGAKYRLNGQVKGDVIYIYVPEREDALRILLHEFLEHIIKKEFCEPYILLTQMLSQTYDDLAYFRQERIIDALTILLSKTPRKAKLMKLGMISDA